MIRNWDVESLDLVTSGGSQFLYKKNETAASVRHRLLMFFGEWYLDISDGTPWLQTVLGKKPQDAAEQAIKERIATDEHVVSITSFRFSSDRDLRSIHVDAEILDINDETVRITMNEGILDG